jgi:hypothetical protein
MPLMVRDQTSTGVSLVIPAEARYFHVARSVATAVAGDLDVPMDTVDDLRLALTECCNLLVGPDIGPTRLNVRFWTQDEALQVEVAAEGGASSDERPTDSLSWTIVVGLADEAFWEPNGDAPAVLTRWRILADPPA